MPEAAKRILIAEDEEGWRELLEHWLKRAGYEVRVSSTGRDVLPLARSFEPNCFILDHDIGDTTGYNVCLGLKKSEEFAQVPVILLTANVDVLPKVAASCAANHFIAKSESPDELLMILEGIFAAQDKT